MPMLFSPTIEAAITAGYWFLRARCPACRTTGDVDLRKLDWHRGAAVTALIPALSCRSCRPNAPFAELVCLSKSSVAEEYYAERSGNKWINEQRGAGRMLAPRQSHQVGKKKSGHDDGGGQYPEQHGMTGPMGGEWAVRDKHANNEHTGSYQDNIVQIVHAPHYSGLRLRNYGRGRSSHLLIGRIGQR